MIQNVFVRTCLFMLAPVALALTTVVFASDDEKKMPLPPGWTEADMQACTEAGTPGRQHEHLRKSVGTWVGKHTMWMSPEAPPVVSECSSMISAIMDGRFVKCETTGEMPMGPFSGFGIYGFDNVSQKFVSSWIDNCGTGIMQGTGDLSADGKVMTWTNTVNCPVAKKPVTMRQVETVTGDNTSTLEMFSPDPKTGREFKMMQIDFRRK
jgi:hypothetical protein